ncbi:hypothetical protein ACVGOW_21505 [Pseudonocardia saturnea]
MIDDKAFVEQLAQLAALRAADVLTEHEFVLAKAQVLGSQPAVGADGGAGPTVAAAYGTGDQESGVINPAFSSPHAADQARPDRLGIVAGGLGPAHLAVVLAVMAIGAVLLFALVPR